MTSAEIDQMYEVKNKLDKAVRKLTDEMTKDLSPEQDETLRQMMVDEFRFWRYP